MIAVDTNILVYAHRVDSPWHEAARDRVRELAEGRAPWAIAWPCLHEFYAIVTHPRVYAPPTPQAVAFGQVEAWLIKKKAITEEDVERIHDEVHAEVEDCLRFAEESAWPAEEELYTDILV